MISRRQIIRHQLEEGEGHQQQLRTVSSLGANNHHHHQLQTATRLDQFDPYSIYGEEDDEEDVWYSEDRLFEDHIQEVMDKWHSIDDEIWAKIICMERNRRIAKAYGRKHVLTINGSHDDYIDGTILGLNSFDNPDRDVKTKHIKQYIGHGVRIKIDDSGDIWVKRLSKCSVYLRKVNNSTSGQSTAGGAGTGTGSANNNNGNSAGNSSSSSDSYMANSSNNSDLNDFYGIVGYPSTPMSGHNNHNLHNNGQNGSQGNQRHLLWTQHKAQDKILSSSSKQQQHKQQQQQQQQKSSKLHATKQNILSPGAKGVVGGTNGSTGSTGSSTGSSTTDQMNGNGKHHGQQSSTSKIAGAASKSSLPSSMGHLKQQKKPQSNGAINGQSNNGSKMLTTGEINSYGSVSLDTDVAHKIFDMEAFKLALAHELRQSCPNRCKLLNCCISIISFVVDDKKLFNLPSWVMIINIVAIDLLKTELGLTDQDLLNPMHPGALMGQPYSPVSQRMLGSGHNLAPMVKQKQHLHHSRHLMMGSAGGDIDDEDFQHLRTRLTNKHQKQLFNNMDDSCLFVNNHQHPHPHHRHGNNINYHHNNSNKLLFSASNANTAASNGLNLKSSLSQENLLMSPSLHNNNNHHRNGFAAARKAFADAAAAGIYNQVKLTGSISTSDMMHNLKHQHHLHHQSDQLAGLTRYKNIQIINNHHQCDDNCPDVCRQQQMDADHKLSANNLMSHSKHDLTNVEELSSEGSCSLEATCCCHQLSDDADPSCLQHHHQQHNDGSTTNGAVLSSNKAQVDDKRQHHQCSHHHNHNNSAINGNNTSNNNLSSSSGFESHSSSSMDQHALVSTSASSVLMSNQQQQQQQQHANANASLSGADTTSASIYGPIKINGQQQQLNHLDLDNVDCDNINCECQCSENIESTASSDQQHCSNSRCHRPPKLPQRYMSPSTGGGVHDDLNDHHHCHHSCNLVGSSVLVDQYLNNQHQHHLNNQHHHSSVPPVQQGANLLLVAPTGLSPQLPTKLPHSSGDLNTVNAGDAGAPRFSTIQYIDGNGQCNVIHNSQTTATSSTVVANGVSVITSSGGQQQEPQVLMANNSKQSAKQQQVNTSKTTLPPGIPAHAQLAPPATQKHILRYVMSAVKNVTNHKSSSSSNNNHQALDNNNKQQQNSSQVNFTSKQRPLPILPTQQQQPLFGGGRAHNAQHSNYMQQHNQQVDEDNLYYCGLQARVPAFRRFAPSYGNSGNNYSSNNINAILTDISGTKLINNNRRGNNQSFLSGLNAIQHHQNQHQHHQQQMYHNNKQHHQSNGNKQSALGPKNRLLLDQLKMLSSVQNHPNVLSSSSNLLANHHNSLFLSADNLNHAHRFPLSNSNALLTNGASSSSGGANSTKKEKKGVKLFSLSSSSSSNQSTEVLASQDQENSASKQNQKSSKSTKRTKTTRKS